MSDDADIRRLFAESVNEPADDAFLGAVERKVTAERRWSRVRLGVAAALGLLGVSAIAPSLGAITEQMAKAATAHSDLTQVAMSLAGMPALQAAALALAAAGGALAFARADG